MQWQLAIHTQLDLEANSPKVITDLTGLLSSAAFLDWISEKKISHAIADSTAALVSFASQSDLLNIFTSKTDIPAFVTNKWQHRTFSWADIPLNGNAQKVFRNLSLEQLIDVLEVVYSTNRHQIVGENDIPVLLKKAEQVKAQKRITGLKEHITNLLEQPAKVDTLLEVGKRCGELVYLTYKFHQSPSIEMQAGIDDWSALFFKTDGLEQAMFASTPKSPKTVDKILPNLIAKQIPKVALVCFDCMGWAEWSLLKDFLVDEGFSFEEESLLAMMPSVTSISRSAIFQGNREVYHLKTPGRTTEAKSFAAFFDEKHCRYFTEQDNVSTDSLMGYNAVSLLYSFFDDLCHATHFPPGESTKAPYFEAVQSYLRKSTVKQDLNTLFENGFSIYLCSDHGSIVATGNGKRLEKYLIDNFAKRAVMIPAKTAGLINQETIKIPFVEDKLLALPEGRTMFANKNQIEVNHGGITVEEMVVPFIIIMK
jgi:hypothetical protein